MLNVKIVMKGDIWETGQITIMIDATGTKYRTGENSIVYGPVI